MDMILDKKVELIEWLCGEDLILQHVQSRKLITTQEYTRIKSVRDPSDRATEVLDIIVGKGDSACAAFLNLLKEDKVNESKPELRKWITTVNIPDIRDKDYNSSTTQAGNMKIADNQKFLKKTRGALIDQVKNVNRIVDDLSFTDEMEANVRAEPTEQAKMRKVLEYTTTRKAAQLLIDALFKHAEDIMKELTMA